MQSGNHTELLPNEDNVLNNEVGNQAKFQKNEAISSTLYRVEDDYRRIGTIHSSYIRKQTFKPMKLITRERL